MDLDKRLFAIPPDHKPGSKTVDGFETTLANTRCADSGTIYGPLRKICSAGLERDSASLQTVDGEKEPLPTPPDHFKPRQKMDCNEVHHPTPADVNAGVEGVYRLQIDLSAHIHSGLICIFRDLHRIRPAIAGDPSQSISTIDDIESSLPNSTALHKNRKTVDGIETSHPVRIIIRITPVFWDFPQISHAIDRNIH